MTKTGISFKSLSSQHQVPIHAHPVTLFRQCQWHPPRATAAPHALDTHVGRLAHERHEGRGALDQVAHAPILLVLAPHQPGDRLHGPVDRHLHPERAQEKPSNITYSRYFMDIMNRSFVSQICFSIYRLWIKQHLHPARRREKTVLWHHSLNDKTTGACVC
jgi:hypothetical protein